MQNITRKQLLILIVLSFSFLTSFAQRANTLYFMRGVPQVYQVNPAIQPDCKFFLGLPGVAPLQVKAENSTFGIDDILSYDASQDSLITFLHPNADKQAFLDILKERNYVGTEFSTSLASFGYAQGKSFVSFDIRERFDAVFSLPGDLFRLPLIGPDSGTFYDFNGMGVNAKTFMQFSLGISHKFTDKLTIGWRGKLLFGQAAINTDQFDFTINNMSDSILIHSNPSFNASVPYLSDYVATGQNVPMDVIFQPFQDEFDNFDFPIDEIPGKVVNPKNFGMAMDLGVDYRATDWLQVSASVVDFGRIKWKQDVFNLTHDKDLTYKGVEFDITEDDFGESFLDSLESDLNQFSASETDFVTWLPTKLYIGAAFYPLERLSFGVLSRTMFYDGDIRQQFTASLNMYPIRMISTTFTYSIIDGYYNNLGFGLALKAGPLNMYLMTDTGPSATFWPTDARYANFKIGFNIMVGGPKRNAKDKVDRPLID